MNKIHIQTRKGGNYSDLLPLKTARRDSIFCAAGKPNAVR